ncbi:MAG: hypothetical protein IPJ82_08765 [Lewinellaceae bacterium]|nr:hypothetical protein [Lewinellaceae bacterium]
MSILVSAFKIPPDKFVPAHPRQARSGTASSVYAKLTSPRKARVWFIQGLTYCRTSREYELKAKSLPSHLA